MTEPNQEEMTEMEQAEMTDVVLDKAVDLSDYELPEAEQVPPKPHVSKRTYTIGAIVLLVLAIVGGVLIGTVSNTTDSTSGTISQPGASGNTGDSPISDVPTTTDSPKDTDLIPDTGTTDAEDPVTEDEDTAEVDTEEPEDEVTEDEVTEDEVTEDEVTEDEVTEDVVPEETGPEMSGTIYDLALSISGDTALEDTSSPTYLAFEWMSVEDTYTASILTRENHLKTRYSLAVAYYSFLETARRLNADGTDVSRHLKMVKSNWMSDINHCKWDGISCQNNGCVTDMVLVKYGLTGSIPDELSQLTCLEFLNLSRNDLKGSIPDSLYTLSNLEKLHLNKNRLSGSISDDLGALTNLENLYLGENRLSGSIPETVANMESIIYFSVFDNQITGELSPIFPDQISYIDLGMNLLTGDLPEKFANYRSLSYLYLDHNKLTGDIPDTYSKMGNNKLETLYLNNNDLTGTLPTTFGGIWLLTIRTEGNDITIHKDTCKLLVLTGNAELVELGADCDKCSCEDLCDPGKCYE